MSELVRQNLITALVCGSGSRLQDHVSSFYINLTLTDAGLENVNEIIRIVFAYINKLK
jgi:secreted Zn-dependent insulinase-like peptidase